MAVLTIPVLAVSVVGRSRARASAKSQRSESERARRSLSCRAWPLGHLQVAVNVAPRIPSRLSSRSGAVAAPWKALQARAQRRVGAALPARARAPTWRPPQRAATLCALARAQNKRIAAIFEPRWCISENCSSGRRETSSRNPPRACRLAAARACQVMHGSISAGQPRATRA